jgi:hypothetical protein
MRTSSEAAKMGIFMSFVIIFTKKNKMLKLRCRPGPTNGEYLKITKHFRLIKPGTISGRKQQHLILQKIDLWAESQYLKAIFSTL